MRAALRMVTILFLAALAVAGCQSLQYAFYRGPLNDKAYRTAYNRWTSGGKIYDRLDTVIFIQATLKSPGFTSRYVETFARIYQLSDEEKSELAGRLAREARESNEFVLSAFTSLETENSLDDPRSSFKLYLVTPDGRRHKPLEVRRIKKVNEAMRVFFPHISSWRKVYMVRFPGPQKGALTLVVVGPQGKVSLKYPSGS